MEYFRQIRRLTMLALTLLFLIQVCWTQPEATTTTEIGGKKGGETKHQERYQVFSFDFQRVELPIIICLWVLIASLAKIGSFDLELWLLGNDSRVASSTFFHIRHYSREYNVNVCFRSWTLAFHLHHKLAFIVPESCLLIVLGLILGAIFRSTDFFTKNRYVLNADIFFIYLLPPIIFDAGYFMPNRNFFDNIGSVLVMAFINTLINTVLIGFSLYAISLWGFVGRQISMLNCLIFSAFISAVDPVAVLATFEEVRVNQMLYLIVFGESLLNDGVTVVIFHMIEGFIEIGEQNIISIDVWAGVLSFFIVAIGGSFIGIMYGFFGGFITKYTKHVKVLEPLLIFVLGYLMYLTSEMIHLSGILALSFGGIVLRHYVESNVSKPTATTIKYIMKMLANISETIIFMFLGLSTMAEGLDWNLSFIFFALIFCLIYRVVGVVILAWLLNRRRLIKLTFIDQFIMAYGGLRGGIAFCLSLSLNDATIPEKKLFITTTVVIIFFTVFVQGITIKPVVNALKVKREEERDPSLNEKIHETMIDHLMAGVENITDRSSHNLMRTKFRRFNHKYLKPLLMREDPNVKATKLVHVYNEVSERDALKSVSTFSGKVTRPASSIALQRNQSIIVNSGSSAINMQNVTVHRTDTERPNLDGYMNESFTGEDNNSDNTTNYLSPDTSREKRAKNQLQDHLKKSTSVFEETVHDTKL